MSGIPFDGAPDRPNENFLMLGRDNVRNTLPVRLTGMGMVLHHYLLDIRPGQTVPGIDWIAEHVFPLDSRESVRRANRELLNAGLVILRTRRDERGRFDKRYQVFYNPQPEADRTPSKGRLATPRKPGQPKGKFPQVAPAAARPAAGEPAAGRPAAGEPADKELKTEGLKTKEPRQDQKMASRRARSSAASAIWSDSDKITGVRTAIADVYGDADNEWISDAECLELYGMKAPKNGRVRTPAGYMTKIFEDTPDLGTHLAGLGADFDDAEPAKPPRVCPRCEGTSGALTERGVCAWCDAELPAAPSGPKWPRPVLDAIKTALFVAAGYVADDAWAAKVATHIIGTRSVARPAEYVTSAITTDSDPRRFTPTWTPAPARAA